MEPRVCAHSFAPPVTRCERGVQGSSPPCLAVQRISQTLVPRKLEEPERTLDRESVVGPALGAVKAIWPAGKSLSLLEPPQNILF